MTDDPSAITAQQAGALAYQIESLGRRIAKAEAAGDTAEADHLREKLVYCEEKLAKFKPETGDAPLHR